MNILILKFSALVASAVLVGATVISCNKDNEIESTLEKPQIILDSDDGVYTVKAGNELTIAPDFKNIDDASITWTMDGSVVCRSTIWTALWPDAGQYYVTVSAVNDAGNASEEIRVDVLELTPPVISMRLPEGGLKVKAGTDYILTPDIQHADMDGFNMAWYVDGEEAGHDMSYIFNRTETGIYSIKIKASNIDGSAEKEFTIEVVDRLPSSVSFSTPSYLQTSTDRYTFAGRPVYLRPLLSGIEPAEFRWEVDGKTDGCTERTFKFTPEAPGTYTVKVIVNDGEASAEVNVVCVDATEQERMRHSDAGNSAYSNKVFEWIPAPGQFINETSILGGMTGNETTIETANDWAQQRLDTHRFVSLGSFGGYIIVGFDHSVAKSGLEYDLAIGGNAFLSANGGSNEPGIVWVMQDVNGNGLPDDEWYELKGCESDNPDTRHGFSVTYFRPGAPRMNVEWEDCNGTTGSIRYMPGVHDQDYYYPEWIPADSYTLYGTCIPGNNSHDPSTGYWNNNPYGWGYVDNIGSDIITNSSSDDGEGQTSGFKLSNAMFADGSPVELEYVDFVKVQVAVLANSGPLGEVSTEVTSFRDFSMKASKPTGR